MIKISLRGWLIPTMWNLHVKPTVNKDIASAKSCVQIRQPHNYYSRARYSIATRIFLASRWKKLVFCSQLNHDDFSFICEAVAVSHVAGVSLKTGGIKYSLSCRFKTFIYYRVSYGINKSGRKCADDDSARVGDKLGSFVTGGERTRRVDSSQPR